MDRALFEAQAQWLQEHNQVYADATYREDLVARFSEEPSVPECFESCTRFVPVDESKDDILQAGGPAT